MGKFIVAFVAMAVLLSIVCLGHAILTGITLPYPDPTPEQIAHEQFHHAVSEPLFVAAALAWLTVGVGSACWAILRIRGSAASA